MRADAYFAYSPLARFASVGRFYQFAFLSIARQVGLSLVGTKDFSLHLMPPKLSTLPEGGKGVGHFSTSTPLAGTGLPAVASAVWSSPPTTTPSRPSTPSGVTPLPGADTPRHL